MTLVAFGSNPSIYFLAVVPRVMAFIDRAEDATRAFVGVPAQIRRSLAVYLLVRRRSLANQSKGHFAPGSVGLRRNQGQQGDVRCCIESRKMGVQTGLTTGKTIRF